MLKPDEKRRINEALTKCNGDKQAAADMLQMDVKKLRWAINNNKDLRAFWTAAGKRATAVEVLNGPMLPDEPRETPEQAEAREEEEFRKHLENLGLESGDVVEARALSKVYGSHIGKCINLIGGGITKRALALMKFCEKLDLRFAEGFSGENADVALANWTTAYVEAHKLLAGYLKAAALSSVARAKIKALQEAANGNRNRGKPSFGPKQTNIIAKGPVQVNT